MNEFFRMAMFHGIHKLAKVGKNCQYVDPFAPLILDQLHQSSTLTVAHLNIKRVFSKPRGMIPKLEVFEQTLVRKVGTTNWRTFCGI